MKVPVFIEKRKHKCGGTDCGTCASVCDNDCITYGKSGKHNRVIFKLVDCIGCGKCAEACFASQCIEMVEAEVVRADLNLNREQRMVVGSLVYTG